MAPGTDATYIDSASNSLPRTTTGTGAIFMFDNAGADIGGGYAASSDISQDGGYAVVAADAHATYASVDEAYEPVAGGAPVDDGVASWVGNGGAGVRATGSKFSRNPSVYNGFGTGGSGSTDA